MGRPLFSQKSCLYYNSDRYIAGWLGGAQQEMSVNKSCDRDQLCQPRWDQFWGKADSVKNHFHMSSVQAIRLWCSWKERKTSFGPQHLFHHSQMAQQIHQLSSDVFNYLYVAVIYCYMGHCVLNLWLFTEFWCRLSLTQSSIIVGPFISRILEYYFGLTAGLLCLGQSVSFWGKTFLRIAAKVSKTKTICVATKTTIKDRR